MRVFISSDAPAFTVSHADIVVYEGEKVNLSCEAGGFPPPQPMWTCDGANVLETTKYLLIGQIKRSIQCNCTAHNYLDSATKAFNIVVRELSRAAPPAGMTTPDAAPQFGTAHLCFLHFHLHSFHTKKNESD